jgi:hypothetical protein
MPSQATSLLAIQSVIPDTAWDEIVTADHGSIFASSRYQALTQEHLSSQLRHLGAFKDNRLVGVLPSQMASHPVLGSLNNSSPFYGSHGGVYTTLQGEERAECIRSLLVAYKAQCLENGCRFSNLIEPLENPEADLYQEILSPWKTDERIGQVVQNIEADPEAMMARYHYKTRNMVRKAEKIGIAVCSTDEPSALDYLYNVHVENMLAINGKEKSKDFFARLPKLLRAGEDWLIYEAHYQGKRIASMLAMFFGQYAEYYTPVIEHDYRPLQPMSLIVHEAMLDAARRGYRHFNFGGTWKTQESVYRFKSRWGADDISYRYYINAYPGHEDWLTRSTEELLSAFPGFYIFPL